MGYIQIIIRGIAMGIAEVIPGVSGGTIAFITGIYEKLLQSIQGFDHRLPRMLLSKGGIKRVWERVNGRFLISLAVGMIIGIVIGVKGVTRMLEDYPPVIWAFFFGLIIASVVYIGRQLTKWTWREVVLLIGGGILAYLITVLNPVEGRMDYWYIFLSGSIAISALILPGISGSFMLLLLGLYTTIIPTLELLMHGWDWEAVQILAVFGIGCIFGLLTFAKVLTWAFHTFKNGTLALLTGFMLGSLNKIWPWRNPIVALDQQGALVDLNQTNFDPENMKLIKELNVLPVHYLDDPFTFLAIVGALVGFALVFVLGRNKM